MVTHEKHVDAYGQMFFYDSQFVIANISNNKVGIRTYIQCDRSEAYIYSHLVKVMKF